MRNRSVTKTQPRSHRGRQVQIKTPLTDRVWQVVSHVTGHTSAGLPSITVVPRQESRYPVCIYRIFRSRGGVSVVSAKSINMPIGVRGTMSFARPLLLRYCIPEDGSPDGRCSFDIASVSSKKGRTYIPGDTQIGDPILVDVFNDNHDAVRAAEISDLTQFFQAKWSLFADGAETSQCAPTRLCARFADLGHLLVR